MTPELNQLILEWNSAAQELKTVKAREMDLRKKIVVQMFPTYEHLEGTEYADLGSGGWRIKLVAKQDRKLDEAVFESIREDLAASGVQLSLVVAYEPKLSVSNYKKLNDEQRMIFDKAITMKPASPSLELVAPKTAK